MTKELKKRLEEVALELYPSRIGDIVYKHCDVNADTRETLIEGGTIGYELGYKEAIAQAKEWIRHRNRHACKEWLDKECADFEADMNKLFRGEI